MKKIPDKLRIDRKYRTSNSFKKIKTKPKLLPENLFLNLPESLFHAGNHVYQLLKTIITFGNPQNHHKGKFFISSRR
jgi:hypothetical protein